jgi:hypothetical protein
MLRKQVLSRQASPPPRRVAEKDIAALATVSVTSEDPDHPIDNAFDDQRGPDGSRWIAEQPGEQTVIVAFDTPQTLHRLFLEINEPDVSRTQELTVSVSGDAGATYRELVRQEFNFSPPGTTRELEEWAIAERVSHLRLVIKPDKGGGLSRATLTVLALE